MAGLRRDIVNLAHNYSSVQKAVRKATSNDPWGPSSTLMAEIADLTYNVVAFTEIMQMLWKRLNDHGKNWRHVYKALVLLEYLIKTGSEKVAQQCKENIFAIQTLKDFQYMEGAKDQGINVREKAKQLVSLLKDEERLGNERARALKAKERFAQTGDFQEKLSPETTAKHEVELDEELQLQLALAMSREEADLEEQRRRSDDVRLQLALDESQKEFKSPEKQSHLLDLLDVNWGQPKPQNDPWSMTPAVNDPWAPVPPPKNVDPWSPITPSSTADDFDGLGDAFKSTPSTQSNLDDFDFLTGSKKVETNGNTVSPDPFDLRSLEATISPSTGAVRKTPESFLGENSALVNLDNLVSTTPAVAPHTGNPFAEARPPPRPTINQIRQDPWSVTPTSPDNPFLS